MDEVFIRIQGVLHYLWRAVDQDGVVLDILVQPRRDANAGKRFFKRLLKGLQYVPRVIVTETMPFDCVFAPWSLDRAWARPMQSNEHSGRDGAPLVPVLNITFTKKSIGDADCDGSASRIGLLDRSGCVASDACDVARTKAGKQGARFAPFTSPSFPLAQPGSAPHRAG
jgi:hypothetical protein